MENVLDEGKLLACGDVLDEGKISTCAKSPWWSKNLGLLKSSLIVEKKIALSLLKMKSSNKTNAGVETIKTINSFFVFCFCKNCSQSSPSEQPLSLNSFIQQNVDDMYLVIYMWYICWCISCIWFVWCIWWYIIIYWMICLMIFYDIWR